MGQSVGHNNGSGTEDTHIDATTAEELRTQVCINTPGNTCSRLGAGHNQLTGWVQSLTSQLDNPNLKITCRPR